MGVSHQAFPLEKSQLEAKIFHLKCADFADISLTGNWRKHFDETRSVWFQHFPNGGPQIFAAEQLWLEMYILSRISVHNIKMSTGEKARADFLEAEYFCLYERTSFFLGFGSMGIYKVLSSVKKKWKLLEFPLGNRKSSSCLSLLSSQHQLA